ncbi:MAG: hypothetical protein U1F48_17200 [Burkholderiales bacterium]
MADYDDIPVLTAWQCIGCGRLEAPQQCVGVCQDRKVELVTATVFADTLAEAEALRERVTELERVVRQLATITPRAGQFQRSYESLQARARALLGIGDDAAAAAAQAKAAT